MADFHRNPPNPAAPRDLVSRIWTSSSAAQASSAACEHVLPTGQLHIVFRLCGPPLRIMDPTAGAAGTTLRGPVVGGPRSGFYAKRVAGPVTTVGAVLRPDATLALFGVSAEELAERHTPLADLWGSQADDWQEQLLAARSPPLQAELLGTLLSRRMSSATAMHPAVRQALDGLRQVRRIDDVVLESRYSHRGLIALFRQATGLAPKRYARLMRFQRLLKALHAGRASCFGELALDCGFSDQSHMNREFRAFSGITPQQYRLLAPTAAHHVTLGAPAGQFSSRQGC